MIFNFLVLKNENFGFENPYEPVLDDFGEFWKNPKNARQLRGGRGGVQFSSLLRIWGTIFISEAVTFLKSGIFKKKIFWPQFGS